MSRSSLLRGSWLALAVGAMLVAASPAPSAGTATIVVGMAANGTTVRLHRGDVLAVRLAGNPTTGYRWSAVRVPPAVRLLASRYVPSKPQRLGSGGTYVFRFGAGNGSGKVVLHYRRPWEPRTPLRIFMLTVRSG